MFHPPEGLPAWPLLLPSENISKVVVVDKVDLSALTTALVQDPLVLQTPDPATALSVSLPSGFDSHISQIEPVESEVLLGGASSFARNLEALTNASIAIDQLHLVDPPADEPPGSTDSSSQSSVTYATVLLSDPKREHPPIHLHYKDGSGSSSSDEGNFSANNSDISGSFHGGLWELDDPRRSCSYNSVEELSETSEQEDGEEVRGEKDLYYLGMDYPAQESEEDEEQMEVGTKSELLKSVILNREDCCMESHPLLGREDSVCGFSSLYLPQFRTAQCNEATHSSTARHQTPAVTLTQAALD